MCKAICGVRASVCTPRPDVFPPHICLYEHFTFILEKCILILRTELASVPVYCLVTKPCPTLFATPWTVALQAPLSMAFLREGYWGGLPFPYPGNLSDPGVEPVSPTLAGGLFTTEPPGKPVTVVKMIAKRLFLSSGRMWSKCVLHLGKY